MHFTQCPYLTSIRKDLLNLDDPNIHTCTQSLLSDGNIFLCLCCGRSYQGKSKGSPAHQHSIRTGHHIYIHLKSLSIWCLPDDYEVTDDDKGDSKHSAYGDVKGNSNNDNSSKKDKYIQFQDNDGSVNGSQLQWPKVKSSTFASLFGDVWFGIKPFYFSSIEQLSDDQFNFSNELYELLIKMKRISPYNRQSTRHTSQTASTPIDAHANHGMNCLSWLPEMSKSTVNGKSYRIGYLSVHCQSTLIAAITVCLSHIPLLRNVLLAWNTESHQATTKDALLDAVADGVKRMWNPVALHPHFTPARLFTLAQSTGLLLMQASKGGVKGMEKTPGQLLTVIMGHMDRYFSTKTKRRKAEDQMDRNSSGSNGDGDRNSRNNGDRDSRNNGDRDRSSNSSSNSSSSNSSSNSNTDTYSNTISNSNSQYFLNPIDAFRGQLLVQKLRVQRKTDDASQVNPSTGNPSTDNPITSTSTQNPITSTSTDIPTVDNQVVPFLHLNVPLPDPPLFSSQRERIPVQRVSLSSLLNDFLSISSSSNDDEQSNWKPLSTVEASLGQHSHHRRLKLKKNPPLYLMLHFDRLAMADAWGNQRYNNTLLTFDPDNLELCEGTEGKGNGNTSNSNNSNINSINGNISNNTSNSNSNNHASMSFCSYELICCIVAASSPMTSSTVSNSNTNQYSINYATIIRKSTGEYKDQKQNIWFKMECNSEGGPIECPSQAISLHECFVQVWRRK